MAAWIALSGRGWAVEAPAMKGRLGWAGQGEASSKGVALIAQSYWEVLMVQNCECVFGESKYYLFPKGDRYPGEMWQQGTADAAYVCSSTLCLS